MLNKSYKEVLILGLNNDQIPYILIIKKLGYKIFGVDKNENAPGKKYCDYFKKTSYTNVKKIIKFLKNKKFSSNGFFFYCFISNFAFKFS